uniref:Uncharacterized protein n=1 Tax=Zea mays TaxID=4577 RepID=A0A804NBJ7_MAIZE
SGSSKHHGEGHDSSPSLPHHAFPFLGPLAEPRREHLAADHQRAQRGLPRLLVAAQGPEAHHAGAAQLPGLRVRRGQALRLVLRGGGAAPAAVARGLGRRILRPRRLRGPVPLPRQRRPPLLAPVPAHLPGRERHLLDQHRLLPPLHPQLRQQPQPRRREPRRQLPRPQRQGLHQPGGLHTRPPGHLQGQDLPPPQCRRAHARHRRGGAVAQGGGPHGHGRGPGGGQHGRGIPRHVRHHARHGGLRRGWQHRLLHVRRRAVVEGARGQPRRAAGHPRAHPAGAQGPGEPGQDTGDQAGEQDLRPRHRRRWRRRRRGRHRREQGRRRRRHGETAGGGRRPPAAEEARLLALLLQLHVQWHPGPGVLEQPGTDSRVAAARPDFHARLAVVFVWILRPPAPVLLGLLLREERLLHLKDGIHGVADGAHVRRLPPAPQPEPLHPVPEHGRDRHVHGRHHVGGRVGDERAVRGQELRREPQRGGEQHPRGLPLLRLLRRLPLPARGAGRRPPLRRRRLLPGDVRRVGRHVRRRHAALRRPLRAVAPGGYRDRRRMMDK